MDFKRCLVGVQKGVSKTLKRACFASQLGVFSKPREHVLQFSTRKSFYKWTSERVNKFTSYMFRTQLVYLFTCLLVHFFKNTLAFGLLFLYLYSGRLLIPKQRRIKMKRLQLIVPMLACCLALPCLSFTDVKDSYLVLQVDTTQKYEQYSYVNEKGETVVPSNRYLLCYTDTIVRLVCDETECGVCCYQYSGAGTVQCLYGG